jgi:YfiR/HmsC-like
LVQRNNLKGRPKMNARRRLFIGALLLGLQGPLVGSAVLAAQFPTEYQFKADSLFNLLKFVEWPENASAGARTKWVIGVVGSTPVTYELVRMVAGKTILGRELKIEAVQSADGMRACHVLFISASERKRLPSILAGVRGYSVLTVSDMDNFVESGGMVQFVMADERVRMMIDVGAATGTRLKISAKLLALASAVTARNAE